MVNDEFMNQTTGWKDVSHARRSGEVGGLEEHFLEETILLSRL